MACLKPFDFDHNLLTRTTVDEPFGQRHGRGNGVIKRRDPDNSAGFGGDSHCSIGNNCLLIGLKISGFDSLEADYGFPTRRNDDHRSKRLARVQRDC
jgi:hypothetical protein